MAAPSAALAAGFARTFPVLLPHRLQVDGPVHPGAIRDRQRPGEARERVGVAARHDVAADGHVDVGDERGVEPRAPHQTELRADAKIVQTRRGVLVDRARRRRARPGGDEAIPDHRDIQPRGEAAVQLHLRPRQRAYRRSIVAVVRQRETGLEEDVAAPREHRAVGEAWPVGRVADRCGS